MKRITALLAIGLCLPAALPAQHESLRIGPGDQIDIRVFQTPDLDQIVQVSDKGDVSLLLGGELHVASMTPPEAAHAVERVLVQKNIMYSPRVSVTVKRYATQNVTVFGQVVRPASYQIDTPRSVVDVLTLAGGFTDIADHHVTIERGDGAATETVFVSNDPKQNEASKTLVSPGDKLMVPKAPIVYVLGDVGRAGGFPMENNDGGLTVLQAVAQAGGLAPSASGGKARLIRKTPDGGYKELPLALPAMEKGKRPDMQLQANDIVYVPFSFIKNSYLGLTGILASATSAAIYIH